MRVCDRCGSRVCTERYRNHRFENEVDFCAACNDAFLLWVTQFGVSTEDKEQVEVLRRKRGRPPIAKEV